MVSLAGGNGEGCNNRVVVAREPPRCKACGEHGAVKGGQATDRVTVADPVDAAVIGFARQLWPGYAVEPVERHDTGAIVVATGLPTVDESLIAQSGVNITGGWSVEISTDDDGQVLEWSELVDDDVDGAAP